jgi:hypothetical protein
MAQANSYPVRRRRPLITWTIVTAALAVVAFAISIWLTMTPLPFDRTQWDATLNSRSDTTRHRMADGLVQSKGLVGKSRSEIVEMLGPPDTRTLWPELWDANYYIGPCRHIVGVDTEFLVLKFDDSGILTAAAITED